MVDPGATGDTPSPEFNRLFFFVSECFKVRLREYERQSKTIELAGPYALDPGRKGLCARDVRYVRIFFAPLYMHHPFENPGSAPANCILFSLFSNILLQLLIEI